MLKVEKLVNRSFCPKLHHMILPKIDVRDRRQAYVKRTKKGETRHLIEAILDYSTFNPSSVKVGANSISHHFGTFPRSLHRQVIDISNTANCL